VAEHNDSSIPFPAGTNWAGNLTYSALMMAEPRSTGELQAALSVTSGPVKFLGSRHCFNDIADTVGTMISMSRFEPLGTDPLNVISDGGPARVRVPASTPYGQLAQVLAAQDLALANFASLPHITIAGAIATGTHGSGDDNPPLIDAIWAFELVTPLGDARRAVRDGSGDLPFESGVHLGLLGALTFVEIEVQPAFEVRQDLYQDLPWRAVLDNFAAITGAAYSVSIFSHWNRDASEQLWLKSRISPGLMELGDEFYGARRATRKLHPLPDTDPIHCTDQLGVPGPSYDRLPHFKMGFTPSKGEELQSEYLVPREHAPNVVETLLELGDQFRDLLFVSEIRTMQGDSSWLSPTPRDSVGFHFTWRPLQREVIGFLPTLERALAPYDARPHWGKLHTLSVAQIAPLYPNLGSFLDLARECDPEGRLRNEYSMRVLGY
jgi:xylitol oxidase